MSIRLMAEVWQLDLTHTEQAVLLALTDHADDDGGRVFPSLGFVGWKTGYSERQVRRTMRALEDAGLIELETEAIGHRPNEYRITLEGAPRKAAYVRADKRSALSPETGRTSTAAGRTSTPPRADIAASAKPSDEPPNETPTTTAALAPRTEQEQERAEDQAIASMTRSPADDPDDPGDQYAAADKPAPAPSDRQVYLIGRLWERDPRWLAVKYGAIVALNKRYSRQTATEALGRAWEETQSGTLAPDRPYALLESIAEAIKEQERTLEGASK